MVIIMVIIRINSGKKKQTKIADFASLGKLCWWYGRARKNTCFALSLVN
jgi:hypothetical protein